MPKRILALLIVALASLGAVALSGCGGSSGPTTLTIITHDSFNMTEDLIKGFEKDNNVTVKLLPKGDAGAMLTSVILSKDHPEGDALFGVDNTMLTRALDAGIFLPYSSPLLNTVPNSFKTDIGNLVTPIDYGYVNLNYDIAALKKLNLAPPAKLEDLTQPQWKGKVVVENPATSSPGLAFLIATVDYFGADRYLGWWKDMRANGLVVVDGWETAYEKDFTLKGGQQPIVLSYASSPPFEQMFAKPPQPDSPTGNILAPKSVFLQIEYAGVLKGTKNEKLARKFIDFLLSRPAQEDVPGQMAVYPVNQEAKVPEAFDKFGKVDQSVVAKVSSADITKNRDKWIQDWTRTVLQ